MSTFIITIGPDGDPAGAHTTVRVDTSTGEVRIAEVTVRGGEEGLAPADLPVINFELLMQAIAVPGAPVAVAGHRLLETGQPAGAEATSGAAEAAAPPRRSRAAKTAGAGRRGPAAKATGTSRRARAGTAAGSTTRRAKATGTGRAKAEPAATGGKGETVREYRRMPDPTEVVKAYEQVGTIKGLTEYFGVPRHTINGWARRLRSQGYQIGRGETA